MRCNRTSGRPYAARLAKSLISAICLCLPALFAGCAAPVQTSALPDALPANLTAPCLAGPPWPEGDQATIGELIEIALERETAAAECRARHARLVRALQVRRLLP